MKKDNISYLNELAKVLEENRIASPLPEAEILVSHYSRIPRIDFYAGPREISDEARAQIEKALQLRLEGEPLQYILGETEFCGRPFEITRDTLIPRPETEILVEHALGLLNDQYPSRGAEILDLGTGSGCIAVSLTLARPDSRMTALDISQKALAVARKNFRRHGLEDKARLVQSDLFGAFAGRSLKPAWDLIVCNPPYIPEDELGDLPREVQAEPMLALSGGEKGLRVIAQILAQAPFFLKPGGWLFMEIGLGQSGLLMERIVGDRAYKNLKFIQDYSGIDRVLAVQKNG